MLRPQRSDRYRKRSSARRRPAFPSRGSAAAAADPRRCMAFPTLYSRRRTASRGRRQSGSPPDAQLLQRLFFAHQRQGLRRAMRTIIWRRKRRSSRINPASSVTACRRSCSRFVMPPLFRRRRGVRKLIQPARLSDHTLFDKIAERHHRPPVGSVRQRKIRWQTVSDRLPVLL